MYLGTRRSHLMRAGGSSATLTDYELIEQDSLFYQEGRDWHPGTVLGWAGDVRHSSRYRFRAAAIACIFGDNHYEASLIAKAYELVRDLAPADLFSDDAALLELLYHTCIGDARSVPAIAHQYAQMVRRSPDKLIHIRGLRRAGNALNRVGLFTEALEYLTEALLLAEKLNLPVQQCSAHAHLAIAYIELADVDNARSQLVRLHEAEANAPTDTNPRAVDCYAMILAWLTSDTTLAMSQLQRFPAPSDRILDAPAHYLLASRIGLQSIVDASTLSEADLTACRRLYERGKAFGQQDLRTSMMLAGMTARGAVGEAREIATRYLADFRRDLSMPRTKQLVSD